MLDDDVGHVRSTGATIFDVTNRVRPTGAAILHDTGQQGPLSSISSAAYGLSPDSTVASITLDQARPRSLDKSTMDVQVNGHTEHCLFDRQHGELYPPGHGEPIRSPCALCQADNLYGVEVPLCGNTWMLCGDTNGAGHSLREFQTPCAATSLRLGSPRARLHDPPEECDPAVRWASPSALCGRTTASKLHNAHHL